MTTLSESVLQKYTNHYFVETGTSEGSCVELALRLNFNKIISIELNEPLQLENIRKFHSYIESGRLDLIIGDSLFELINIIPKLDKPTTFWLDAHVDDGPAGVKRCPLYEELSAIKNSKIKTHTILIDDMRCLGGGNWGHGISIDGLKSRLLEINPNYMFKFEDGWTQNDILVAHL